MRQLLRSRRARLVALVTFVLACLLALSGTSGNPSGPAQQGLSVVLAPFRSLGAALAAGPGQLFYQQTHAGELARENERLTEENAALKQQLADHDRLAAENESFRRQLELEKSYPELSLLSACVTGSDPLARFGSFSLDKGSAQGIAAGMPVLSEQGFVVGCVDTVQPLSCTVMTLLDPDLNIACLVSSTRENGILCGDTALYPDGLARLTGLPRESAAASGDLLLTSGLGGVFPADLPVGTLQTISTDASGKTLSATVLPDFSPRRLTAVFVVLVDGTEEAAS